HDGPAEWPSGGVAKGQSDWARGGDGRQRRCLCSPSSLCHFATLPFCHSPGQGLEVRLSGRAMIIGHGIDLVDVARIAASVQRHGQRFCDRVFTEAEQVYAAGSKRRMEHLAARFAAKEAALKALGTGWRSGIAWTDVEVRTAPSGAPTLHISGRAAAIAAERGIGRWHVSLTHTEMQAMASVIAEGRAAGG